MLEETEESAQDPRELRVLASLFERSHDGSQAEYTPLEPTLAAQPLPGWSLTFRSTPVSRQVHHHVIVFAVDRTQFVFSVTSVTPNESLWAAVRTFRVLRERAAFEPESTEALLERMVGSAPQPSAETVRTTPRSEVAGAPSVLRSCNQMGLMGHCWERAAGATGYLFYDTETTCGSPHELSEQPCPMEDRVGSCVVGGQQVAHFYRDSDNEGVCDLWGGEFRPALPRVLPINPG